MDDVLVYTNGSREEHWGSVHKILKKLEKAGLFLDVGKCDFLCKEVKYLGFIIRAGEDVTVDPAKLQAISDREPPIIVKGVRSFLGFAKFYRCFVKNYSETVGPLIALTRRNAI